MKAGRFITHMKKLRDVETPLANFFASGLLALGDKLGPVLWQLPPNLGFDEGRMRDFLALLPHTTTACGPARGAARRAAWRAARGSRPTPSARCGTPSRCATRRTRRDAFLDLLRAHEVAAVTADTAGRWPLLLEPTTDLAYVRLHGDAELYVSGYDDEALDRWATRVQGWQAGGADVVVYFDNDVKVRAPVDAERLMARLGLHPPGHPD